jgi:hypothetical protein
VDLLVEAGVLGIKDAVLEQLELFLVLNVAGHADVREFSDIYGE